MQFSVCTQKQAFRAGALLVMFAPKALDIHVPDGGWMQRNAALQTADGKPTALQNLSSST